ncbi:unnamed protein product [Symbiodinium natans]|uniref:C2 domain-containing protein n=1 Tax=Symbiodinium natans TaxID=878477 RepID=A0A812S989_9DINO|nr:unnamed protein product [Symbiodinium natans]
MDVEEEACNANTCSTFEESTTQCSCRPFLEDPILLKRAESVLYETVQASRYLTDQQAESPGLIQSLYPVKAYKKMRHASILSSTMKEFEFLQSSMNELDSVDDLAGEAVNNLTGSFKPPAGAFPLMVEVWDSDVTTSEFIGEVGVSLSLGEKSYSLPLRPNKNRGTKSLKKAEKGSIGTVAFTTKVEMGVPEACNPGQEELCASLTVTVSCDRAHDVAAMDRFSASDPYCLVRMKSTDTQPSSKFRTKSISDTLNPDWTDMEHSHTFSFLVLVDDGVPWSIDSISLTDQFMANTRLMAKLLVLNGQECPDIASKSKKQRLVCDLLFGSQVDNATLQEASGCLSDEDAQVFNKMAEDAQGAHVDDGVGPTDASSLAEVATAELESQYALLGRPGCAACHGSARRARRRRAARAARGNFYGAHGYSGGYRRSTYRSSGYRSYNRYGGNSHDKEGGGGVFVVVVILMIILPTSTRATLDLVSGWPKKEATGFPHFGSTDLELFVYEASKVWRCPWSSDLRSIAAQQKELKGKYLAVEAELKDAQRRATEAQAQVSYQESKRKELQRTIAGWQEEMATIESKKTETMEEIRQKAREIGDDGADLKLDEVRKSPTLQQYLARGLKSGSLIQEYAKLHFEVEDFKSKIQAAQSGSAKNEQVAAEHRKLREVAKEQAEALKTSLRQLQRHQEAMQKDLDQVAEDEETVQLQRKSLERTVEWAKSTSPLTPITVDTLGSLVATRAEAIRLALAISGSAHLQVLRDLKCLAFELRSKRRIAEKLRKAGFAGQELKEMGFSARELHQADIPILELFTGEELKAAGFSARELREIGTTVLALMELGFQVHELRDAGCDSRSLEAACNFRNGTSVAELSLQGFEAIDLKRVDCRDSHCFDCGKKVPCIAEGCPNYRSKGTENAEKVEALLRRTGAKATHYVTFWQLGSNEAEVVGLSPIDWKRLKQDAQVCNQRTWGTESEESSQSSEPKEEEEGPEEEEHGKDESGESGGTDVEDLSNLLPPEQAKEAQAVINAEAEADTSPAEADPSPAEEPVAKRRRCKGPASEASPEDKGDDDETS